MNILIIDNSIGTTGALNAIIESIAPLRSKHVFLFVVPAEGTTADLLRGHGFTVVQLPFIEISRSMGRNLLYPFRLLRNAWKISRIVKREHISVIQVNDLYNLTGLVAKRFVNVKVITHVRRMPESFPFRLYQWWVKQHERSADRILPVSNANARIFQQTPKTEVFYDPLPPQEITFDYNAAARPVFQLLYLANFTTGKGQNHALAALKDLHERRPEIAVQLHFIGSDFGWEKNRQYRNDLEQWAKDNGIAALVTFSDGTSNIAEPIARADIMLNFSDSESLSRVSMEALYFGVPLIATNVGGTNEMVIDSWNGLLVEKGDVPAMSAALELLLESEELRATFSRNGKTHVAAHFAPDVLSLQLEAIYSSLQ